MRRAKAEEAEKEEEEAGPCVPWVDKIQQQLVGGLQAPRGPV